MIDMTAKTNGRGLLASVCLLALLAGCETTGGSSPSTEQITGGIGGAVLAGGIAALAGGNPTEIALAAAGGAVAGYLIGDYFTRQREDFASTEAYYDANIADAGTFNAELQNAVAQLQGDVDRNELIVQNLESQYAVGAMDQSVLERELASSSQRADAAQQAYADAQSNLDTLKGVYAEAQRDSQIASAGYTAAQGALITANQQLASATASAEDRMAAQSALPRLEAQIAQAETKVATLGRLAQRTTGQRDRLVAKSRTGGAGTSF